eukprot:CAMPEP_0183518156 /NCGR_PEP_ID=MMETSP0371-20130417/15339_1 /TAXON_ID=268820 /ORGANISM="Peridinium aciculiferum, Strain PAER-2" /LENGTH=312 /DNA_ID=CAMNT_0025716175 /DNA_START=67 /DNA_END=1000 /DNA_ORIENTATION=+
MGAKQSMFDAKLKAKEWQWQLKTEMKHLDKEIKKIQQDEARLQREIHVQAEKGNIETVQMMAKQVVRSRKAVKRLETTKATMHGVCLQLTTSIATMTTSASLRLSADVMRQMNSIAKMSETSATMEQMRVEMAKCADAEDEMSEALKVEGEDDLAADEVQKVLEEMALAKMGPLANKPLVAPVVAAPAQASAPAPVAPTRQLIGVGAEPTPAPRPQPAAQQPWQPAVAPYAAPFPQAFAPAATPAPAGYPVGFAAVPSPASTDNDELLLRLALLKAVELPSVGNGQLFIRGKVRACAVEFGGCGGIDACGGT